MREKLFACTLILLIIVGGRAVLRKERPKLTPVQEYCLAMFGTPYAKRRGGELYCYSKKYKEWFRFGGV